MKKPWISLLEVSLFYLLVHFIIWSSGSYRPPVLAVALVMVGICIGSNRYHHDSWERIGFAKKNFWPATKMVAPLAFVMIIPLVYLSWGKQARADWGFWFSLLGYPIWGLAQQYALLGFVANRLEEGIPSRAMVPWINGFLFGMAHLPNPLLMALTFLAGTVFTFIFLKKRHLVPLAIIHALFGVALSMAFSDIHGIMSVGPAYLNRIGQPF